MLDELLFIFGAVLTLIDFFELTPKIESFLDRTKKRMFRFSGVFRDKLLPFLDNYLRNIFWIVFGGVGVIFISNEFGIFGDAGLDIEQIVYSIIYPFAWIIAIFILVFFSAILLTPVFWILAIILQVLSYPPKGTIATIAIVLMLIEIYSRYA